MYTGNRYSILGIYIRILPPRNTNKGKYKPTITAENDTAYTHTTGTHFNFLVSNITKNIFLGRLLFDEKLFSVPYITI